jgi:NAD(P)-dependent dehydrogenase (short-subunit alcohol dehydrogenase family)
MEFKPDSWALILGGSSGFGLAAAKKLSRHGMNIFIVHRDRKGAMDRIEAEFEKIRKTGTRLVARNENALSPEGIKNILQAVQENLGEKGKVRLLLHSIAYGNLKLLAPVEESRKVRHEALLKRLAGSLEIPAENLRAAIDRAFEAGDMPLARAATPPLYGGDLLQDEDFALTIYSMGSSLATWVREVYQLGKFAGDARVLGMTSEGNEVAWRGYAAVSAAKAALEAIVRSIAVEYAPFGIRANVIQAGVTDTPALRLIPGNQHLKASAETRNPFQRLTTPEDVADFIYLMCLDEAAWVNGNVIRVDGGEHIGG